MFRITTRMSNCNTLSVFCSLLLALCLLSSFAGIILCALAEPLNSTSPASPVPPNEEDISTHADLHSEDNSTYADLHSEDNSTHADLHSEDNSTYADLHSEDNSTHADLHSDSPSLSSSDASSSAPSVLVSDPRMGVCSVAELDAITAFFNENKDSCEAYKCIEKSTTEFFQLLNIHYPDMWEPSEDQPLRYEALDAVASLLGACFCRCGMMKCEVDFMRTSSSDDCFDATLKYCDEQNEGFVGKCSQAALKYSEAVKAHGGQLEEWRNTCPHACRKDAEDGFSSELTDELGPSDTVFPLIEGIDVIPGIVSLSIANSTTNIAVEGEPLTEFDSSSLETSEEIIVGAEEIANSSDREVIQSHQSSSVHQPCPVAYYVFLAVSNVVVLYLA